MKVVLARTIANFIEDSLETLAQLFLYKQASPRIVMIPRGNTPPPKVVAKKKMEKNADPKRPKGARGAFSWFASDAAVRARAQAVVTADSSSQAIVKVCRRCRRRCCLLLFLVCQVDRLFLFVFLLVVSSV